MAYFRFVVLMFLLAVGITALILGIDYLVRPKASILKSLIQKYRYDQEVEAVKEKQKIWEK